MIKLNTEYSKRESKSQGQPVFRDHLEFSFPEVHNEATFTLEFQRTLRIPDDGKGYPLPPGLGCFPLRHVDDYADRLDPTWRKRGGVMMPMYQSEAMWIRFGSPTGYPFMVKIAAGKINALTGSGWENLPCRDPQDYLVVPDQPWLDGFCVDTGFIRQFVAAPLGKGYTVEEQLTGQASFGGLQIIAYPMKPRAWQKWRSVLAADPTCSWGSPRTIYTKMAKPDMGLAIGGKMKQEIAADPHTFGCWDLNHFSRCFVHFANSQHWHAITGEKPPTLPPSAEKYSKHGYPWFEYYSEPPVLEGSNIFSKVKSIFQMDANKSRTHRILPENVSPEDIRVIKLNDPKGIHGSG